MALTLTATQMKPTVITDGSIRKGSGKTYKLNCTDKTYGDPYELYVQAWTSDEAYEYAGIVKDLHVHSHAVLTDEAATAFWSGQLPAQEKKAA